MPARPQQAGGVGRPGRAASDGRRMGAVGVARDPSRPLRFATHNVRGIQGHLPALLDIWEGLHLDVVFLQETHLDLFKVYQVERSLQRHGYTAYWAHHTSRSAGVGILIRSHLLQAGVLTVEQQAVVRSSVGRYLVIPVQWRGHSLHLINLYLPNESAAQQDFMQQQLQPLLAAATGGYLLGGDWNFVECTSLDRLHRRLGLAAELSAVSVAAGASGGLGLGRLGGSRQGCITPPGTGAAAGAGVGVWGDGVPGRESLAPGQHQPAAAKSLHALHPEPIEVFRALHPAKRSFTFHSGAAASRLDRFYVSSAALLRSVCTCRVEAPSPSDHRLVLLELLPSQPPNLGPGLRRIRLHTICGDDAARQAFQDALQQAAAARPQFQQQQQQPPQSADDNDAAQRCLWARNYIDWWPSFKGFISGTAIHFTHEIRAAHRAAADASARQQAAAALEAAYAAVETASTEEQAAAALSRVLQARAAWTNAVNKDRESVVWQNRKDWIHAGERPSPTLTAALCHQKPPPNRFISALRSPATGRLVTDGHQLAELVGQHWARVSTAPHATPQAAAAAQEVLDALASSGLTLSPSDAETLGSQVVTEAEVLQALKHSKPGKAPGLDGIPVDLYRKYKDVLAPVLTDLYCAIGLLGEMPRGFLDGVLVTPPKPGEPTNCNNYRPLTLLNADYRVLAKVLSRRLRDIQHKIIEPEQSGFMPGRHIGDNLMLLQLLPVAVGPFSQAVTIFADFYKAYDTLWREFMFRVLQVQGVGAGFLRWVRLLLSDTGAHALVNGWLSSKFRYTAGVRQGCPLSPQLYICVAQALLTFLKAKGFGVPVAATTLTASQFADDTQVFLQSMARVPAFLECMQRFKEASGQGLNLDKTSLMPIGRAAREALWQQQCLAQLLERHPTATPESLQQQAKALAVAQYLKDPAAVPDNLSVSGLRVVSKTKCLGLLLKADGTLDVDWQARLAAVMKVYGHISHLPLSTFGRGFASASYGVSKLLYAAEFAGLPPADIISQLEKATTQLVDRKLAPASTERRFPALTHDMLIGHPRAGGFGSLPWRQHILARHVMWAVRLMLGNEATPWVSLARSLLLPAGCTCPAWRSLAIALCPDDQHGPTALHLPKPLHRLVHAFRCLPPWQDFGGPEQLSSWCRNVPLWCNPFLCKDHLSPGHLPARGLEQQVFQGHSFQDFANLSTFTTLQHALAAHEDMQKVHNHATYQPVWTFWFKRAPGLQSWEHVAQHLHCLVQAIPLAWRQACTVGSGTTVPGVHVASDTPPAPSAADIMQARLVPRIGWYSKVRNGHTVTLSSMSVKEATALLVAPVVASRQAKHQAFLQLAAAHPLPPFQSAPTYRELTNIFSRLWNIPWDNHRKEFFWRFSLDGIPTAARMHMVGASCACGVVAPDRAHHYWDCPIAQAVLAEIKSNLPAYVATSLHRVHVWLARVPVCTPALHKQVWLVVCQAALLAMDKGRRVFTAIQLGSSQPSASAALPSDLQLLIAQRVAVTTFWDMLADFAGLRLYPPDWLVQVQAHHPFLGVMQGVDGSRRLVLHRA